jgi:uncharacterized protein
MPASPIEVVGQWLQDLLDPDVVTSVVAPDATYVSLNTENPELAKVMPWVGTSHGPRAFLDNLGKMFTRWDNQAFNVTPMFASDENVAVFGCFRYKSHSLGKVVSSPFSILVQVVDGRRRGGPAGVNNSQEPAGGTPFLGHRSSPFRYCQRAASPG